MSRILIYESLTAGPLSGRHEKNAVPSSLATEGLAMAMALAEDFAALPQMQVTVIASSTNAERLRGRGFEVCICDEHQSPNVLIEQRGGGAADVVVAIAPEIDSELLEVANCVQRAGGRMLGASLAAIELCSDKHRTAAHLREAGIAAPHGMVARVRDLHRTPTCNSQLGELQRPCVVKPIDGAGSVGRGTLRLGKFASPDEVRRWASVQPEQDSFVRVEDFHAGMAASVVVLVGARETIALPAMRQILSDDGAFRYLGGSGPLPPALHLRAQTLARRAVAALPRWSAGEPAATCAYFGVDLILADSVAAGGPGSANVDTVIEINPRPTTSYVGLRRLANCNLAGVMLDLAEGSPAALSWHAGGVQFDTTGNVRYEHAEQTDEFS